LFVRVNRLDHFGSSAALQPEIVVTVTFARHVLATGNSADIPDNVHDYNEGHGGKSEGDDDTTTCMARHRQMVKTQKTLRIKWSPQGPQQ
jgi:hypothetical protein